MTTVSTSSNSSKIKVISVAPIDWPSSSSSSSSGGGEDSDVLSSTDELLLQVPKAKVQCGTLSYLYYNARKTNQIPMNYFSQYKNVINDGGNGNGNSLDAKTLLQNRQTNKDKDNGSAKSINLKTLTKEELDDLSYYEILGNIKMHSTQEQIKRAFHKACLKYHPDKEDATEKKNDDGDDGKVNGKAGGKGEDPIFLKVKEAFETLSDPKMRKSYDSTVDFDDSIPSSSDIKSNNDFYAIFGSCFERNLRFAAENEPGLKNNTGGNGGSNKKGKRKGNNNNRSRKEKAPPSLGDDQTPIDQVHVFYDYWVNFESWRDFTLPATKETEHDTDMAECRFEKRWMEKEITRKAKAMKRDEMARISKLVERSMGLDPRLQREKERIEREKKEKIRLKQEKKEREEKEKKEKEEKEAKEKAEQELRDKEERVRLKAQRDQEKKVLRKARQALRKAVLAQYEVENASDYKTWDSFEDMNEDLELLCSSLSALELGTLTNNLKSEAETNEDTFKLEIIQTKANELKIGAAKKSKEELEKRNALRKAAAKKDAAVKAARASNPWSKEELSALAKAVKKYPAGCANRWETIALFVNNLCKLPELRKREECIEKYNSIAAGAASTSNSVQKVIPASNPNQSSNDAKTNNSKESTNSSDAWTDEQDKQLQEGLAKYPSSMDKNERWTSIASCVTGKSKKECVQRFKAIRMALKKK